MSWAGARRKPLLLLAGAPSTPAPWVGPCSSSSGSISSISSDGRASRSGSKMLMAISPSPGSRMLGTMALNLMSQTCTFLLVTEQMLSADSVNVALVTRSFFTECSGAVAIMLVNAVPSKPTSTSFVEPSFQPAPCSFALPEPDARNMKVLRVIFWSWDSLAGGAEAWQHASSKWPVLGMKVKAGRTPNSPSTTWEQSPRTKSQSLRVPSPELEQRSSFLMGCSFSCLISLLCPLRISIFVLRSRS
mmetsp:Transcript_57716/g.135470  ORF Transcript_57716/g.135470 Transcript_57716/m.135470 type:complete len:246 (+) Transcript_57716:272-1009(+)